ncbi:MAG TPA: ATP-binding protein, partial [Candidatus Acidoferrum sp.]|nr:ATP-binding protein [Candidatus Acidoferrum sp.]
MIPKPFLQIGKDDIDALVTDATREGRTIEYKQELAVRTDAEKKEFLADVSSFANASGGDLLLGVEEERDAAGKTTGVPSVVDGLAGINADRVIQQLENIIRTGVEPRIPGLQIKAVDGFPSGPVIVIRVPQSWAAPHMILASPRFYSRTSVGKAPLGVPEIRAAFVQSETLPERIRRFREERIGRIVAGEGPVPLVAGPTAIFHLVPTQNFHSGARIDVVPFLRGSRFIVPLSRGANGQKLNLDGYVSWMPVDNVSGLSSSYVQVFRDGSIEAVDVVNHPGLGSDKWDWVSAKDFEADLIVFLRTCLDLYKAIEIEAPLTAILSWVGVQKCYLHS